MYDPKVRMMILLSVIVAVVTFSQIMMEYVFGTQGIDFSEYITGASEIALAILGGFSLVWLCTKFMTFESFKSTGFEPVFVDETGTGFNFPVSLSKFLPEIIAQPYHADLHPLEAELIGFLNGYRSWPFNLDTPKVSLYQHALAQWQAMKEVPEAGPMHRIAALAQDLGKTYAYEERRKVFPYWQFWKQDAVRYTRRCTEHGGLSAFLLSTMPSFRKLGTDYESNQQYRRALLTAVRYRDNPSNMPANVDPLAKSIYEALHMASRIALKHKGANVDSFTPKEEDIEALNTEIGAYFQAILRDIDLNPAGLDKQSTGVYLGRGLVALNMGRFTAGFVTMFSPEVRNTFNLWNIDSGKHPVWQHIIRHLKAMHVLLETWENIQAVDGLFNLRIGNVAFSSCLLLEVKAQDYPDLRKKLDALPHWSGIVEAEQDRDTLLAEIQRKATQIDTLLQRLDG